MDSLINGSAVPGVVGVSRGRIRRDATVAELVGDEEGTTLIELLIAIILIGLSFAALSGVVVTSLQGQLNNERESVATATAQQLLEQFQGTSWASAAVYRNEVDESTPDAARYRSRLTGPSLDIYDGLELVALPDPGAGGRDASVPEPWFVETRRGMEYAVDVYPVWTDVDGDGADDHRQFIAVASWTGNNGQPQELVVAGERAPTQQEAGSSLGGYRATYSVISPRRTELDAGTSQDHGELMEPVEVQVRFNKGVANPTITFSHLELTFDTSTDPSTPTSATATTKTLPMTTTEFSTDSLTLAATVTIPANTYYLRNGGNTVLITATGGAETVRTSVSLDAFGGPWAPSTGPSPSPSPSPSPTPSPTTYPGPVTIPNSYNGTQVRVCVSNGQWDLTKPMIVGVTVNGMTKDQGTVGVTVPFWTAKTTPPNTPTDPNNAVTLGAVYTADVAPNPVSPHQWKAELPTASSQLFQPGATIKLTVEASRNDGSTAVRVIDNVKVVTSC